jgi:hypothetical protein
LRAVGFHVQETFVVGLRRIVESLFEGWFDFPDFDTVQAIHFSKGIPLRPNLNDEEVR